MAISLIAGLVTTLIGFQTLNSIRLKEDVQVMAHRGASLYAPENTLASIQAAIDQKADWIEVDVQETVDGEVVVLHDSDFMKLAKNPVKIWNARYEDLKAIDIGSWFDSKFADQRVPTLREVLEQCRGKIKVNIELKYYGHDQQLEQRVVDIVEQTQMTQQVIFMSLKHDGVKKLKRLRPTWKCGLLMSVSVGDIRRIDVDFLAVNAKFVTRDLVKRLHQSGKEVLVWTVNDVATLSMMMNRDVDGILTDNPKLAREVLQERVSASNSERLLMEVAAILGVKRRSAAQ